MNQEDTYRPAVLPSEAVMMPASDETPDAPPPAAQDALSPDDPAMRPAQRRQASLDLERLRNRMRITDDVQWISTQQVPFSAGRTVQTTAKPLTQAQETAQNRPGTISQGAALQTLMRSAARGQFSPAPALTSQPMPAPTPTAVTTTMAQGGQMQMRGALRQAVRNAQQVPASAVMPSTARGPVVTPQA